MSCSTTGRTGRATSSGFTLVESVLSLSILGIVLLSALAALDSGRSGESVGRVRDDVFAQNRRAVDRVGAELLSSSPSVMFPGAGGAFGTELLNFRQAVGLAGTDIVWGPPMQILLEYGAGEIDDGFDNDRDGVVDEGVLVLVRNAGEVEEERIVLCHDVRELLEGEIDNGLDDNGNGIIDERGFNLHWSDGVLHMRLTLERATSAGERVVSTVESAIDVRNQ